MKCIECKRLAVCAGITDDRKLVMRCDNHHDHEADTCRRVGIEGALSLVTELLSCPVAPREFAVAVRRQALEELRDCLEALR